MVNMQRVYEEFWDEYDHAPPAKLFGPRFGLVLALLLMIAFLLVLLLCSYAMFRRGPVDDPL